LRLELRRISKPGMWTKAIWRTVGQKKKENKRSEMDKGHQTNPSKRRAKNEADGASLKK